jgi:light-regulated signal transduction histidine kinase (bacteriophytochrome)
VHTKEQRTFNKDEIYLIQSLANLLGATIERIEAQQKFQQLNRDLERRVKERTRQLESANDELESFSYSVSHDLRAPLRAIHGYANLLVEDHAGDMKEEPREFTEIILDESERMGELIDDLLSFSRMHRREKMMQHIDMNELLEHVLTEIKRQWEVSDANVQIDDLPSVKADFKLLKHVWMNLISNAIKYSGDHPPEIQISGYENDLYVFYTIKDHGVGFDMQYKDKLFGVFERLHSSSEFEGNGIGLALVQRIIHRHEGEIWAESKLGEGSTFSFKLPK